MEDGRRQGRAERARSTVASIANRCRAHAAADRHGAPRDGIQPTGRGCPTGTRRAAAERPAGRPRGEEEPATGQHRPSPPPPALPRARWRRNSRSSHASTPCAPAWAPGGGRRRPRGAMEPGYWIGADSGKVQAPPRVPPPRPAPREHACGNPAQRKATPAGKVARCAGQRGRGRSQSARVQTRAPVQQRPARAARPRAREQSVSSPWRKRRGRRVPGYPASTSRRRMASSAIQGNFNWSLTDVGRLVTTLARARLRRRRARLQHAQQDRYVLGLACGHAV